MRAKQSLYAKLGEGLDDNDIELSDVLLHASARKRVDTYNKVIRIDITGGTLTRSSEPERDEQNVDFTVQCFFKPDYDNITDQLAAEDAALDAAFEMAKKIYRFLNVNKQLILKTQTEPQVCDLLFPENVQNFDLGMSNLDGKRWGACYLYGVINRS